MKILGGILAVCGVLKFLVLNNDEVSEMAFYIEKVGVFIALESLLEVICGIYILFA